MRWQSERDEQKEGCKANFSSAEDIEERKDKVNCSSHANGSLYFKGKWSYQVETIAQCRVEGRRNIAKSGQMNIKEKTALLIHLHCLLKSERKLFTCWEREREREARSVRS